MEWSSHPHEVGAEVLAYILAAAEQIRQDCLTPEASAHPYRVAQGEQQQGSLAIDLRRSAGAGWRWRGYCS